jgi:transcriptional regulator with XRE-family HTH domain
MQTKSKKPHVGRNIQTIRYIRGMSQVDLGVQLEDRLNRPFSQQLISDIENRENIEDEDLLKQIAEILKVTPDALRSLDLDNAINVIGNTFTNNDYSYQQFAAHIHNEQTHNNPLDKLIALFEREKAELKAEIEKLKKKKK